MTGSFYHTNGISILIHKVMKPSLKKISHILEDTFDFVERTDKNLENITVLGVPDVKSLYENILHALEPKALEYWIGKL